MGSIAFGVLLETENQIIEDAAWLRKKCYYNHISVVELEAILKEANLALKLDIKDISVPTDSSAVYGWVNVTVINGREEGQNQRLL